VYYRGKYIGLTKTDETMVLAARSLAWSWGEMAIALVTHAMECVLPFERICTYRHPAPDVMSAHRQGRMI
jgi:hypothetical protein